ncbi:MAG TPA: hypothetical protein VFM02_00440 [Candidatus Paceibacterota bacterium]|nr:hypothetical protein [Candidatus Paceibacterota bacterium]
MEILRKVLYFKNNPQRVFQKLFLGFFVSFLVIFPALLPVSFSSGVPQTQVAYAAGAEMNAKSVTDAAGGCSIFNPSGWIVCIAWGVIYWPASKVLHITGDAFNAVMVFSLDTKLISGSALVTKGWGLTRDIVDSLFIFIILYIAISLILQLNTGNAKRMLVTMIVVALLINFSLFFAHLVIDASNVAAVTFYNHIGKVKTSDSITNDPNIPERDLSEALVAGLAPQKMIDTNMFGQAQRDPSYDTDKQSILLMIIIMAAILNMIAAVALLTAIVVFLARIVILWLLMIVAPFAFLGFIIPKMTGNLGQKWISMLLSQSFVAPVFLFFFYLLIYFIGQKPIDSLLNTGASSTWTGTIITLMLVAAFYIVLFLAILGVTVQMSGKGGKAGVGFGKYVAGAAVGGYVGAWAASGRQSIGRGATLLSNSKKVRNWRDNGRGFGYQLSRGIDRTAKSSFDVRSTKAGQKAFGATGLKSGMAAGGQGGFKETIRKRNENLDAIQNAIVDPEKKAAFIRWRMGQTRQNGRLDVFGPGTATRREFTANLQAQRELHNSLASPEEKAENLKRLVETGRGNIAKLFYQQASGQERAEITQAMHTLANDILNRADNYAPGSNLTEADRERLRDEAGVMQSILAPMEASRQNTQHIPSERPGDQPWSQEYARKKREKDFIDGQIAHNLQDWGRAQTAEERRAILDRMAENEKQQNKFFSQLNASQQAQISREIIEAAPTISATSTPEEIQKRANAEALQKRLEGSLSEEHQNRLQETVLRDERTRREYAERKEARRVKELVEQRHNLVPRDQEDADIMENVKKMGRGVTELSDAILQRADVIKSMSGTQLRALQQANKISEEVVAEIQARAKDGKISDSARTLLATDQRLRGYYGLRESDIPNPPPPGGPSGGSGS